MTRYSLSPAWICPVLAPPDAKYDGIGELWFDTAEAGQGPWRPAAGQAVVNHMPGFVDMDGFTLTITEEIPIIA
jgi:hypothetical protein